jgi:hypothetical protein
VARAARPEFLALSYGQLRPLLGLAKEEFEILFIVGLAGVF